MWHPSCHKKRAHIRHSKTRKHFLGGILHTVSLSFLQSTLATPATNQEETKLVETWKYITILKSADPGIQVYTEMIITGAHRQLCDMKEILSRALDHDCRDWLLLPNLSIERHME